MSERLAGFTGKGLEANLSLSRGAAGLEEAGQTEGPAVAKGGGEKPAEEGGRPESTPPPRRAGLASRE